MQAYILRRLLAAIPVIFVVLLFTFLLLRVTPGDPARIMAGPLAPEEQIQAIRESLGLDRPMIVQLGIFLKDIFQGDFGESIASKHPVTQLLGARILPSVSLTILTELIAVGLGVPLGVLAAWKANSWLDRGAMLFSTLGYSMPLFFLGFLLILGLAVRLPLFPVAGFVHPGDGVDDFLRSIFLPSLATGLVLMALITRMTRASMLEVLGEDYVRTARAKGLPEKSVLLRHALRNSALPILTVIGLGFAGLLAGVVVTEVVFAIPGIGRLTVTAMLQRDYPVIQAAIILVSGIYLLVNLLVDLSYALFDPRIRY